MRKNIIYLLAALTLMACGKKSTTASQEEERIEQVRTTVLQPREIEREISVSTNLQGYLTLNVAPSLTGKIEHIYREVGDRVSAGSDLVRMDQTQYKTTKISMANLTIEKNRIEMLLKTGSATQQQYDQITTQYNSTKEQLEFLEQNTYVKAPFAGVISAKNYEDGELLCGLQFVPTHRSTREVSACVFFADFEEGSPVVVTVDPVVVVCCGLHCFVPFLFCCCFAFCSFCFALQIYDFCFKHKQFFTKFFVFFAFFSSIGFEVFVDGLDELVKAADNGILPACRLDVGLVCPLAVGLGVFPDLQLEGEVVVAVARQYKHKVRHAGTHAHRLELGRFFRVPLASVGDMEQCPRPYPVLEVEPLDA